MTIQINLMSRELLPNVIPTLSQGINSIEKVYLVLAGKGFESKARLLKAFYEQKGIKNIELYYCDDAHDYYNLRAKANELYQNIKENHPDSQIALNATGGTKPMAFAFTQAFDNLKERSMALYTDTLNKRVIILNDADNLPKLPYHSVLNIDEYLGLYDFTVDSSTNNLDYGDDVIKENKALSLYLLTLGSQHTKAISIVNGIAQKTGFGGFNKNSFNPEVELPSRPPLQVKQIFKRAEDAKLVAMLDDKIIFNDELSTRYIGGGWIEDVIYLAALEAGVEHVALNVEGHQSVPGNKNGVKNELDVVLVNNNQILIIEAKTLNWRNSINTSKGQSSILKLDSLTTKFGGAYAKGMIISLFPFTDSMISRTENLRNLTLMKVNSYQQLVSTLTDWKLSTV